MTIGTVIEGKDSIDRLVDLVNAGCPACDCDGCFGVVYCEGCEQTICVGCNGEHNQDAPCHVCGKHCGRDEEGMLTETGCSC